MKSILFLLLFAAISMGAQSAPPAANPEQPKEEPVVVAVEGKKFTAAELETLVKALPPQAQQMFAKDRKEFIRQLARLMHLSQIAEKEKLDQQSPFKEQLELNRMTMLSQAAISNEQKHITVSDEERKQYFDTHKDRFTQAKLKMIYVAFNADPSAQPDAKGKKPRTEAEAKARAEEVLKKIRAGGDFVKLVKEYSEDQISAAENGDFGPIKNSDNIDASIKSTIFAMKPGDVSEPVRQPNGFYIFRLEEIVAQPYDQVKDQIFTDLRTEKMKRWLDENDKKLDVKIQNESYFAAPAEAPRVAPPTLGPPPTPPEKK